MKRTGKIHSFRLKHKKIEKQKNLRHLIWFSVSTNYHHPILVRKYVSIDKYLFKLTDNLMTEFFGHLSRARIIFCPKVSINFTKFLTLLSITHVRLHLPQLVT